MIGTKINNLEIIEEIGGGEGTFGKVFKAKDCDLNDKKAIKIFKVEKGESEKQRFINENKILHTLKPHDNIILPLSDVLTFNGFIYYVLELADFDLERYVNINQDFPITSYLELFMQICNGLRYAHSKNIVHRDLHNRNILIKINNGQVTVKLADFGKARDFSQEPMTTAYVPWGALIISAPEVIAHITNMHSLFGPQAKADIFSLGIVLRCMFNAPSPIYFGHICELSNMSIRENICFGKASLEERRKFYTKCICYFNAHNLQEILKVKIPTELKINDMINNLIVKMTEPDCDKRLIDLNEIINSIKAVQQEFENV